MPGGGAHRWQWIEKPPLYWVIIFSVMMAHTAVSMALSFTLSSWARSMPDAAHTTELRMKGGHVYYLSMRIGWYLNNDVWITFGLLGFLALFMFMRKDKIERIR